MLIRIALSTLGLTALLVGCDPATPTGPADTDVDTDVDSDTDSSTTVEAGWTFEPVDGMVCGGGHSTGIGVNVGSADDELVVVMAGGGACWDTASCFVFETAANLETNWGPTHLANEVQALDASGMMDRSDADNPYRNATFVYVPYCTGDMHSGDSVQYYDAFNPSRATHHAGATNLAAALDHVSTQQPDVSQLWVLGISAGGYGAQVQAHQYRDTWPTAELRVLADGAPMIQPNEYRWSAWQQSWNAQLPPSCPDCTQSFPAVLRAQSSALPDVNFALSTFTEDNVITLYFAQPIGGLNAAQTALITDQYSTDQLSVFRVTGTEHVMLSNPGAHAAANGESFTDFFWSWARGEFPADAL